MTEQELVEFMKLVRDNLSEVKDQLVKSGEIDLNIGLALRGLFDSQTVLIDRIAELEKRVAALESIDRDSTG